VLGRAGFDGDVDDGAFFGVGIGVVAVLGIESAADHPAGDVAAVATFLPRHVVGLDRPVGERVHAGAFGLDGRAMLQVGAEEDLEVGAQRGQLGAQAGHLVGGLCPHLRGEFPPEL
jgi:hypothetical protein